MTAGPPNVRRNGAAAPTDQASDRANIAAGTTIAHARPFMLLVFLLACCAVALSLWAAPWPFGLFGGGLVLLMTAVAISDARHFIVPNELNASALVLGLIYTAFVSSTLENLAAAVLRGALTCLVFWIIRVAYRKLRAKEGIGLGDVKLAFVAGVWLDWVMIPIAVEIAALAALACYVLWPLISKRRIDVATRLPFGLFFAPAIWAAWLAGAKLGLLGSHLP